MADLNNWLDFGGDFLKADLIDSFPVVLVPTNVSTEMRDFKIHLFIETEYKGRSWKIELNRINQKFLRDKGIKGPNQLIGKKLTFEKIKVNNPTTKTPTDSLLIVDIA